MAEKVKSEAAEVPVNDENRTVIVNIPYERDRYNDVVVWINAQEYRIRRGENVSVPYFVAALLKDKMRMERVRSDYERKNRKG